MDVDWSATWWIEPGWHNWRYYSRKFLFDHEMEHMTDFINANKNVENDIGAGQCYLPAYAECKKKSMTDPGAGPHFLASQLTANSIKRVDFPAASSWDLVDYRAQWLKLEEEKKKAQDVIDKILSDPKCGPPHASTP
jgi:hypothetical protein